MWGGILRGFRPPFRVIVGLTSTLAGTMLRYDPSECAPARRRVPIAQDTDNQAPRTSLTLITGDPARHVEDRLSVSQDSPMITSMPFLEWKVDAGPPPTASAPRSEVVSTLLQATRRPSLLAQSQLKELPFVSNKVASTEASRWAMAAMWGGILRGFRPPFRVTHPSRPGIPLVVFGI